LLINICDVPIKSGLKKKLCICLEVRFIKQAGCAIVFKVLIVFVIYKMSSNVEIVALQTGLTKEDSAVLLSRNEDDPVKAIVAFFSPDEDTSHQSASFTNVVPDEIHQLREMLRETDVAIEKMGGEKVAVSFVSKVAQMRLDAIESQMGRDEPSDT
jgi:hypothetical protein